MSKPVTASVELETPIKREGEDLYLSALNEYFEPRYIKLSEDWIIVGKARWKLTDL